MQSRPEAEHSAMPEAPAELLQPLPTDPVQIDAFNAKMAAIRNGEQIFACEHCGHSFHATAMKNHTKLCTAERPFKPAPRQVVAATPAGAESAADEPGGMSPNCRKCLDLSCFIQP